VFTGPLSFLFAQEFQAPRPVKIDGSAEAPLRWKARPIPVANTGSEVHQAAGFSPINTAIGSGVVQASSTSDVKHTSAGGWNKMRIDTFVTPAQATTPAYSQQKPDPFQDPFGDRRATQAAAALQLQPPAGNTQPNTNQPGLNPNAPRFNDPAAPPAPAPGFQPPFQLPSPNPNPAPPPAGNQPFEVPPSRFQPTPPAPMVPTPPENTPPESTPPPKETDPPAASQRSSSDMKDDDKPCLRRYGTLNLNCCESDDKCRAFLEGLIRDKLNNISLDISPRFKPDEDEEENKTQLADLTRLSGVRDWHRRGVKFDERRPDNRIAVGRLTNLQNGRVIIAEENGGTRNIPLNDLSEDDLCFVSGWWQLPPECAIAGHREIDINNRNWMPSTVAWHASALCHKPLYFEQVQHERYGHSAGPFRQPWVDGAHFFGSAILLPYKMALDPPWECEYVLGYYRPGSCAPYHIPPFPFSPRAAMAQAGFVVGGIYVMP